MFHFSLRKLFTFFRFRLRLRFSEFFTFFFTFLILRFWSFGKAHDGRPKGGQPELIELYHPEIWWNSEIKKIWLTHAISEVEFGELNKFKDLFLHILN